MGSPDGIRTRATALRGRRARPLHNGACAERASSESARTGPARPRPNRCVQASAGVPGLEPRLTEPESVGLPITPYPMGAARPGDQRPSSITGRPFPAQSAAARGSERPVQRARRSRPSDPRPAQQLDRLEQRRRDAPPGDRDPHRAERELGLEPETRRRAPPAAPPRSPAWSTRLERRPAPSYAASSAGRGRPRRAPSPPSSGSMRERGLGDEQEAAASRAPRRASPSAPAPAAPPRRRQPAARPSARRATQPVRLQERHEPRAPGRRRRCARRSSRR